MTTIFGACGTTATSSKAGHVGEEPKKQKKVDLAGTFSTEIKVLKGIKAGIMGSLVQLAFVPCIALFLKYPVDLVGGKESGIYNLAKAIGNAHANPLNSLLVVTKELLSGLINFKVIAMILIMFAAAFNLGLNAHVRKERPRTKMEWLQQWFSVKLLCCSIVSGFLTAFLCSAYVSLADWEYSNIHVDCLDKNSYATCIHEKHLFLHVCSFLLGFYMFLDFAIHDKFVVKFPTIEKDLSDAIRLAMVENLWETISITIRFIPVVYIMYFIQGGVFREILTMVGYSFNDAELSNFFQFFDLKLWIQTSIWPTTALFFMKSTWKILELIITERLEIETEIPFSSKDVIVVGDCMNSMDIYMRYLGFYEFMLRTRTNTRQILEFFNLSHPGGHPRIWNGVSAAALTSCTELENCLKTCLKPKPLLAPITAPSTSGAVVNTHISLYSINQDTNLNVDQRNQPVRHRPQNNNMRDLTYPPTQQRCEPPTLARVFIQSPLILWNGMMMAVTGRLKRLYSHVSKLENEFQKIESELEMANALSKYQLILWGINGIVEIACISIDQDKYGVVQRDINSVIQGFVDLHETLLLYLKSSAPASSSRSSILARKENLQTVQLLAQSCMYALSKIHGRFAAYYEILGVPKEYQVKILIVSQLHQLPYLQQNTFNDD